MYKVLVGKPEERYDLEDKRVGGRMGSEWILGSGGGLDSTGSR
jgi:hypothetical protein